MEHIASGSGEIAALFNQSSFLKPLLNVSSDELNEIIINMDSNQNNIITKDEFMTFMNAALERDQLDVLKQLFLMVDTGSGDDNTTSADGVLTMGELEYAIKTNNEVKDLIQTTPSLLPLLLPSTRASSFKAIDSNHDTRITMKELVHLTNVAREHADREYVAHRLDGTQTICDTMKERNKILRYDQKQQQILNEKLIDERKTIKMSGKNQKPFLVRKNKNILTEEEVRQKVKRSNADKKLKYQNNLERVKAASEKRKYFEKTRGSNVLKGEMRSGARAAALARAKMAASSDEDDYAEEDDDGNDDDDDDDDYRNESADTLAASSALRSATANDEDEDEFNESYNNEDTFRSTTKSSRMSNSIEYEDDEEDDEEDDDDDDDDDEGEDDLNEEEMAMMQDSPEKLQPKQPAPPAKRPVGGRARSSARPSRSRSSSPSRMRCKTAHENGKCRFDGRPDDNREKMDCRREFAHPGDDDWDTARLPENKMWKCQKCGYDKSPESYNMCAQCKEPRIVAVAVANEGDQEQDDDEDDEDFDMDDEEFGEY